MTRTWFGRVCAAMLLQAAVLVALPRAAAADAFSPALKQLIADAQKEGSLDFEWNGGLRGGLLGGLEGVTQEVKGMNAMFGTTIVPRLTPEPGSVPQLLAKIAVTQAAGQPSFTDAFLGTTEHIVTAMQRNMIRPVPWTTFLPGRVDDRVVEADGTAVRVLTSIPGGIVYNTKIAPMKPASLVDLLRPEWKGKLATTPYAASFDILSASDMWGEAKTFDFAQKYSDQVAGLIGCDELERVASGEFAGFAMDCGGRDWIEFARQGAPVDFVVPSDYAARRYYYMMIPKNAVHPNAGALLVTYILTKEGQDIEWKTSDTDLDTFADSHMRTVLADYEKQGVKFREITLAWWKDHPEVVAAQHKIVELFARH